VDVHKIGPITFLQASRAVEEVKERLQGLENLFKHPLENGTFGTRINFDSDPNGNPIREGTRLDIAGNPYASLGVTFKAIPGSQGQIPPGGVYARNFPRGATSPPNIVSLAPPDVGPGDNESYGKIQVQFAKPCSSVTVSVKVSTPFEYLGMPGGFPTLHAYNSDPTQANAQAISTSSLPMELVPTTNSTVSPTGTPLTVIGSWNITYVTFSCPVTPLKDSLVAFFDDLSFF
jgi:hypothetical protein